jgi:hypothetical protein
LNRLGIGYSWEYRGIIGITILLLPEYKHFDNPEKIVGGMVWDVDHGTTRVWGGSYNGHLPRITSAWVE